MAKFNLNGLVGYLQGKGWKIKMNADEDEEEVFEVEEDNEDDDEEEMMKKKKMPKMNASSAVDDDDPTAVSEEELVALRGLAQVLAKNSKLVEAIENGTLDTALTTVPAAAELVRNAQARDKQEKDQVIALIKQNSSNSFTDEELDAMPTPSLVKLNAQMNVNYAGLGGGSFVQNSSEQPLGIRPVLLAQPQKEA